MLIIIMGVCGSGKSSFGKHLSEAIGCDFIDADSYHSKDNLIKLSSGTPLTDEDRWPWFNKLREVCLESLTSDENLVLACSALKQRYRDFLMRQGEKFVVVMLDGSKELLSQRLNERKDHFMNPSLLDSQLEALERPDCAVVLNIENSIEKMVEELLKKNII